MAIQPCPDCGKDVSTMAPACPHCGYPMAGPSATPPPATSPPIPPPPQYVVAPPKKGTSPWTVIGWIVLILFCLVLYSCVKTAMRIADAAAPNGDYSGLTEAAAPTKNYQVKVIDSGCEETSSGRYTRIRATVENTGTETIPFGKAFFEAYDKAGTVIEAKDSYFSPTDIPPGARASADVMLRGDVVRCAFVGMQGSGGERVSLQ